MSDVHRALIYTLVFASAADSEMTDNEIRTVTEMVSFLPVFRDFDHARLPKLTEECIDLLKKDDGVDLALDAIERDLPPKLGDTAYAIACDVVAVDFEASQEELQLLEMLRHRLKVDRLTAAAIERGAKARFKTI